jgi:uncharacterized membrane protein YhaH (DUF805 family)
LSVGANHAAPPDPSSGSAPPGGLSSILRLWFGFEMAVGRRAYIASGAGLMLLKYGIEAALIFAVTGLFWSPLAFLTPVYTLRMKTLQASPDWIVAAMALVTLPFMWVGVTMSVRRAVDAGLSAWAGLAFLVPVLNYLAMIALSVWPPKAGAAWDGARAPLYRQKPAQEALPREVDSAIKSALFGVVAALGLGVAMLGLSVYALGLYGWALFFATPFVMGAVSAFLFNRPHARSLSRTALVSLTSIGIACAAMMLFALEGLVCLMMAFPIAGAVAILGGVVGRAIALQTRTPLAQTAAMMLCVPPLAGAEAYVQKAPLYEVVSAIEIDAPPEQVWPNVIGFSDLDPPAEWVFQTGIAYPMRARIEGEGVGALRHCEFSTGAFVEPITTWDAPRRLSFDVALQPPAMKEWSPFQHVHPPHLDASIRSRRGEFRLIPLEGGRTRLEGSTWYELSMYPQAYWTLFSDGLIHAIHRRVLWHVKRLSETERGHSTHTR